MHLIAHRRLAAAALALVAFAALVATAAAGHWPMFGGDAGHSGHQPVDPGGAPIAQRYQLIGAGNENVQTSPIISGGAGTAGARLVFGTQTPDPADAFAHVRQLENGNAIPEHAPSVDIGHDAPVRDADHFTGAGGSVTPVDTSVPGDPGLALFLHNDDDQNGFGTLPADDATRDPRTGDDIALAMIDVTTGQLVSDRTIGTQDPEKEDTINMTVSSSPVLGPYNATADPPTREMFFLAERAAAEVDPEPDPDTGDPQCNPNQTSFEQPPQTVSSGGPAPVIVTLPRACDVPAQRKLFKVTITNPTTPQAAVGAVQSIEIGTSATTGPNFKASPTLVRLTEPASDPPVSKNFVAIGTTDGFVRTYDTTDLSPGPVSPDLGNAVNTPVVPVRSDGEPAGPDTPIYVTAVTAADRFKAYELRRVEQPAPALAIVDPTRDQSAPITGTPAPAPAVRAAAEDVPAGGRLVITADKNLYSLDVNNLADGNEFDLANGLAAGTTGFSRTTPALQSGLAYVQRDNGEPLVVDDTTLTPVVGFTPFADPNTRAANDGVGQPAISWGFVAFAHRDGVFVYRNQNGPTVALLEPAEGSTLSGTVTLRATAFNARSGVSSVRFLLNGIEAGKGTLVSGSPTSAENPGVYELVLDTKEFGNGTYSVQAEATDADTGADAPSEKAVSAARSVTILNEAPTQLAVGDVEVTEGNEGTRAATFTITKAGPRATTVNVNTQSGSATAGQDYDALSTTVTFAAGDTTRTVEVPVRGDTIDEVDETFTLVLSGPTAGASVADGTGLGIIRDDDAAGPGPNDPVISISSASIAEGGPSSARRMTFDVSLSRPATTAVTVAFSTADQTAKTIVDYRSTSGTLTIPAGKLSAKFGVTVLGDRAVEGDETFVVRLTNPVGAVLGTATGTGLILDDEVARGDRRAPRSVSLKLKPSRDRKAPFRFVATGRLGLPTGVRPIVACQGRISIQVKAGRKTISSRRTKVRANCTYRLTVTFRERERFTRDGRLRFKARFLGNGMLKARGSREVRARTR